MTSIRETEPVTPEPVRPRDSDQIRREEEVSEDHPGNPPAAPDTGKILDTYA